MLLAVVVEALAGGYAGLTCIDLLLEHGRDAFEVIRGDEAGDLGVGLHDVVGGDQAHHVQDLEGAVGRAGAADPGGIDGLRVGDAVHIEVHG